MYSGSGRSFDWLDTLLLVVLISCSFVMLVGYPLMWWQAGRYTFKLSLELAHRGIWNCRQLVWVRGKNKQTFSLLSGSDYRVGRTLQATPNRSILVWRRQNERLPFARLTWTPLRWLLPDRTFAWCPISGPELGNSGVREFSSIPRSGVDRGRGSWQKAPP